MRAEGDPKERYFEPLMRRLGLSAEIGGGRKRAMRDLGREWRGLLDVCDELGELKGRLERWLGSRPA